jgi:hypothetical protein
MTTENQRTWRIPEKTVTIYTGPDLTGDLDRLEVQTNRLPEGEERETLLAKLEEMRRLNDSRWGARDESAESPAVELAKAVGDAWSDSEASTVLPIFTGRKVSEIRKYASKVFSCSDCGVVIAMVIPVRGRPLVLLRNRSGKFDDGYWVDANWWGDVAYCRRRQWALLAEDLRDTSRRTQSVSHSDK